MPREQYQHELTLLQREVLALGRMVEQALQRAVWALEHHALHEAQAIVREDDQIDEAAIALEQNALTLVATQAPVASDLRLVQLFLRVAVELERIGDHAEGIAALVLRSAKLPATALPADFQALASESRAMLRQSLQAIEQRDADARQQLEAHDDQVDTLYARVFYELLERMRNQQAEIQPATYLMWIAHNLERIADRAVNIGESVEFVVRGQRVRESREASRYPPAAPVPEPE